MIYEDRFKPEEIEALLRIKSMLKVSDRVLDYIIAYIGYESNFNPHAQHKISKSGVSSGYIAYLASVLKKYHITPKKLSLLPPVNQILFLGTYLYPYRHKLNSLENVVGVLIDPKFIDANINDNVYNSKLQYKYFILGGLLPLSKIYTEVKSIYTQGVTNGR